MQQAGYHHTNHLAQQLRTNIQQQDNDLLTYIQTAMETNSTSPSIAPTEISEVTEIQHHANATSTRLDPVQLEILKILQQMQQTMALTAAGQPQAQGTSKNTGRPRKKTPDNALFVRQKIDLYRWTHGGSNHLSSVCRARAPGHQDTATFENRMGGSNAFCP